jgi:hypothetical protein
MPEEMRSTLQLEDGQHQRSTRAEWVAERIGWLVIAGLLLAAVLGLLGPGYLSHREAASADGRVRVEYYAIERSERPNVLRIHAQPERGAEHLRLALSHTLTEEASFESIVPEPERMELEDDRIVYVFRAAEIEASGLITYRYRYEDFGWARFQINLDGGSEVEVTQFVCP